MPASPHLLAVDWGTSRLRAYLVDAAGAVLARAESEEGVAALGGKGHAEAFARVAGAWRAAHPDAPVWFAGMIGSRNGWREARYVRAPASLADLAAGALEVDLPGGGTGRIVPGVIVGEPGASDVMRGEETVAFGATGEGLVCIPGTHAKWLVMKDGRLATFRSFVTGEMFGLLRDKSFIGSLGKPGEDAAAFRRGLDASGEAASLLSTAFRARTGVLDGSLRAEGVADFLSGLLIGTEIRSARAAFGQEPLTLVAGPTLEPRYLAAFAHLKVEAQRRVQREALLAGLVRIATAARA
jgi:2-dehydro-3-deoxygalactonokinase